ncbi:hypothetical protein Hanom_Chr06g00488281 [Helianthus anomalus]
MKACPYMSSSDNIILENLDSGESSGQNHSDVTRRLGSDTRALLVLSDSFVSFRTFGSGFEDSGTGILIVELGSVSPDVLSGGVSDISSREAKRNTIAIRQPKSICSYVTG